MSGSTAVRVAIFAAGALVGGGVTAYVTGRQQPRHMLNVSTSPAPMVGFDKTGKTTALVDVGISASPLVSPLKYGHLGQC